MRGTSKHRQALERQVRESTNIKKCARINGEYLNLKNEWGGSKIPGIKVSKPKVIASSKTDLKGPDTSQILQAALKRGCKRMEYISVTSSEKGPEEGSEENNKEG